jgi:ribose/xylose/arabinose/galactoside ABC-type transport system permease subunit
MNAIKNIFKKYTIVLVLIALVIVFSIISPVFFSVKNLVNIFVQQSYVIIAAIGLSFIMIGGGMDLSIGYQMSLVSVITAAAMMWWNLPVAVALVIGLLIGLVLGVVNGVATVKLNVHPLIVTLGTMTIFQGLSYIISQSSSIYGLPTAFKVIGQGYVGPIPVSVIIMVILALLASFILNKTYFGRYIYAIGSNAESARLAGINVNLIKVALFALSGFFVAISAIILTARSGSATSTTGPGTEFTCMTACVLGGVSFKGGAGKVWGVVVGVLILGVLATGMQIIGLGTYPQYVAKGIVLLLAVGIDNYQKTAKIKK